MFGIVIVLVLIVAGVAAYLVWLAEKKRRDALVELARRLDWRFSPSRDYSHDHRFAQFSIFRQGHSRAAYNTLSGTIEIQGRNFAARAGDFRYKITSGTGRSRRTRTYNFSYLIVRLPYRNVPSLLIRREGFFDRIAGFFGFAGVTFESDEFNRMFRVQSSDRKFAYDVIHPRMMQFLMQTTPPTIDIEHDHLCLSDGRRRWEPEEFHRQIRWIEHFFDQWPGFVKTDLEQGRLPVG